MKRTLLLSVALCSCALGLPAQTSHKPLGTSSILDELPIAPLEPVEAPMPEIKDVLPQENITVDVMAIVRSPRIQALTDRLQKAASADQAWFTEYGKKHKDAAALPYHPNFGITQDEYQELLNDAKSLKLQKVGSSELLVKKVEGGVQINLDKDRSEDNLLQPITILFDERSVETPLTFMSTPRVRNGGEGNTLGHHQGYYWRSSNGTVKSGNFTTVELSVGRITGSGKEFLRYKVQKVKNQKSEVDFETTVFYALPEKAGSSAVAAAPASTPSDAVSSTIGSKIDKSNRLKPLFADIPGAKEETKRVEPRKVEPAKVETAKVEPAKPEPVKPEPKAEPKPEPKVEPKVEPTPEIAKAEPKPAPKPQPKAEPQPEPAKEEVAKAEPAKIDEPEVKAEAPKPKPQPEPEPVAIADAEPEVSKAELRAAELAKKEAAKAEARQAREAEAARRQQEKEEARQAAAARKEAAKAGAARLAAEEAARKEAAKAEAARLAAEEAARKEAARLEAKRKPLPTGPKPVAPKTQEASSGTAIKINTPGRTE